MNCSQAREMLSAYRELKKEDQESVALDLHIASCADCQQLSNRHRLVGEQMRSLPAVEPSSQAYTRLMQALAIEHTRFIQRSPSAALTPAPDFLKPYLKGHVRKDPQTDALTAFSRADTGPLPVIRPVPKRASAFHLNHLAIVGLAAAFLLVLMTGGITSVLLLAQNRQSVGLPQGAGKNTTSIQQVSQVTMVSAATATTYPHVVSAVADRQYIYYTAYGENTSDWMLERLDTQQQTNTALLPTGSTSPLIILAGSQDWLTWLQFDQPQTTKNTKSHTTTTTRGWKLYTMSLTTANTDPSNTLSAPATPEVLLQGSFDQKTVPNWVHTPIQGVWFTQDSLLVANIDQKGTSHLTQYPLKTQTSVTGSSKSTPAQPEKSIQELANAHNGNILTSPTANNDGSSIYWSEEWLDQDDTLHSNVWTQQTITAAPQPGKWIQHSAIQTFQFTENDSSFRPQVVNNTLFFLQAAKTDVTNVLQATPSATSTVATTAIPQATTTTTTTTATPTATATTTGENGIIARIDPTIYSAPLDASIQGALQAYSPETGTQLSPALGSDGPISALQAGGRFLIWQNNSNSFDMFDVAANIPVNINPTIVPKDAIFLAVNGDSAVWLASSDINVDSSDITNSTIKFGTFNWPPPKTSSSAQN